MAEVTHLKDDLSYGSLRWAIQEINEARASDISLRVSGTLSLESDLPRILRSSIISNLNLEPFIIDGNNVVKYGLYWDENAVHSHVRGITVINCSYGFYFNKNFGHVILNNIARANNIGFYMRESNNNSLQENKALENMSSGFYISGSNYNNIKQNRAENNQGIGFSLTDNSRSNILEKNEAIGNLDSGFQLYYQSDLNILHNNKANKNAESGMLFRESNSNSLNHNHAEYNGDAGFKLDNASSTTFYSNHAVDNKQHGFAVNPKCKDNAFNQNVTIRSDETQVDEIESWGEIEPEIIEIQGASEEVAEREVETEVETEVEIEELSEIQEPEVMLQAVEPQAVIAEPEPEPEPEPPFFLIIECDPPKPQAITSLDQHKANKQKGILISLIPDDEQEEEEMLLKVSSLDVPLEDDLTRLKRRGWFCRLFGIGKSCNALHPFPFFLWLFDQLC